MGNCFSVAPESQTSNQLEKNSSSRNLRVKSKSHSVESKERTKSEILDSKIDIDYKITEFNAIIDGENAFTPSHTERDMPEEKILTAVSQEVNNYVTKKSVDRLDSSASENTIKVKTLESETSESAKIDEVDIGSLMEGLEDDDPDGMATSEDKSGTNQLRNVKISFEVDESPRVVVETPLKTHDARARKTVEIPNEFQVKEKKVILEADSNPLSKPKSDKKKSEPQLSSRRRSLSKEEPQKNESRKNSFSNSINRVNVPNPAQKTQPTISPTPQKEKSPPTNKQTNAQKKIPTNHNKTNTANNNNNGLKPNNESNPSDKRESADFEFKLKVKPDDSSNSDQSDSGSTPKILCPTPKDLTPKSRANHTNPFATGAENSKNIFDPNLLDAYEEVFMKYSADEWTQNNSSNPKRISMEIWSAAEKKRASIKR